MAAARSRHAPVTPAPRRRPRHALARIAARAPPLQPLVRPSSAVPGSVSLGGGCLALVQLHLKSQGAANGAMRSRPRQQQGAPCRGDWLPALQAPACPPGYWLPILFDLPGDPVLANTSLIGSRSPAALCLCVHPWLFRTGHFLVAPPPKQGHRPQPNSQAYPGPPPAATRCRVPAPQLCSGARPAPLLLLGSPAPPVVHFPMRQQLPVHCDLVPAAPTGPCLRGAGEAHGREPCLLQAASALHTWKGWAWTQARCGPGPVLHLFTALDGRPRRSLRLCNCPLGSMPHPIS